MDTQMTSEELSEMFMISLFNSFTNPTMKADTADFTITLKLPKTCITMLNLMTNTLGTIEENATERFLVKVIEDGIVASLRHLYTTPEDFMFGFNRLRAKAEKFSMEAKNDKL